MRVTDFSGFLDGFLHVLPPPLCSFPGPSCASAFDFICPSAGDEGPLPNGAHKVWLPEVITTPPSVLSLSQASGRRKGQSREWIGGGGGAERLLPSPPPPASLCPQSQGRCPSAQPPAAWQPRSPVPFSSAPLSSDPGPGENAPCRRAATHRLGFTLACTASHAWEENGGEAPRAESQRVPGAPLLPERRPGAASPGSRQHRRPSRRPLPPRLPLSLRPLRSLSASPPLLHPLPLQDPHPLLGLERFK